MAQKRLLASPHRQIDDTDGLMIHAPKSPTLAPPMAQGVAPATTTVVYPARGSALANIIGDKLYSMKLAED